MMQKETNSNIENIRNTIFVLQEHFGSKVSRSIQDRDRHAQTLENSTGIVVSPEAIVYPRSTAEAQQVISICQNNSIPIACYPQGKFSIKPTLEPWPCICLELTRLKQIISIDPDKKTSTVDFAVTIQELNQAILSYRLHFMSELNTDAFLGLIAKNALSEPVTNCNHNQYSNIISVLSLNNNGDIEKCLTTNVQNNPDLNFITEVTVKLDTIP